MNRDEKLQQMQHMLGFVEETDVLDVYLLQAKSLILNTRYPFGYTAEQDKIEPKYEQLQIELAIVLYNERGAEGQSQHSENGVNRTWRSKSQILAEITPFASAL